MSSRLAISSLLCDDPQPSIVPETVVLAPHLRRKSPEAPVYSPSSSSPAPAHKFGLDALVQVASEERRRLSTDDLPHTIGGDVYRSKPPQFQPTSQSLSPVQVTASPYPPPSHYRDDSQPYRSPVDDLHRQTPLHTFSPTQPLPQIPIPRHPPDPQEQQRIREQQLKYQESRQHHELLLQRDLQERAERERERYARSATSPRTPSSLSILLQQPPDSVPPLSRTAGRNSDPGHIMLSHSRPFPSPHSASIADAPRTHKRRRYSDTVDVDMIHDYGSTMDNGQRVHMDIHSRPPTSFRSPEIPRRSPGAERGPLAYDMEAKATEMLRSSSGGSAPHREERRDRLGTPTYILPFGRRSPPGSQAGRAIAARKSEQDHDVKTEVKDMPLSTSPAIRHHHGLAHPSRDHSRPHDFKSDETLVPPRTFQKEEDAHEWLLEHYAASPPSQPRDLQRGMSPSTLRLSPANSRQSGGPSFSLPSRFRTPTPLPDSDMTIEQELEDAAVHDVPGMDIDASVADLVAKTLESPKRDDVMDVDVEDELLSLLDDAPAHKRATSVSKHKRPSALDFASRPESPMPLTVIAGSAGASPMPGSSERGSMPPPPLESKKAPSKKKPAPKPKAPAATTMAAKPKAKPGPKTKPRHSDGSIARTPAVASSTTKLVTSSSRKTMSAAASRSRSTSAMPGSSIGPEGEQKVEEPVEDIGEEDDKLYCICKTKYDQERIMIACDRCDEWYHTQCVNMPEMEVDLVDQFFCPVCVEKHPHLNLNTTYKLRCLAGIEHPDPTSSKACHKPRLGFSKYCSEDCGKRNMAKRIEGWTKKGGKKEVLWESVRDAEQREGVVFCVSQGSGDLVQVKPTKSKADREVERLNTLLDGVMRLRDELKKGMEMIVWREKLLQLAIHRAESVENCGWDQRLCFGEDEWTEMGEAALDSYSQREHSMEVDGAEDDWWCVGGSKCHRHAGWQGVRRKDVDKEKQGKEDALMKLTTKERELRRRIEDLATCASHPSKTPFTTVNGKLPNGHTKGKLNGEAKKGKKRKLPS